MKFFYPPRISHPFSTSGLRPAGLKTPHPANAKGPPKPIWIGGTGTYVDQLPIGTKHVVGGGYSMRDSLRVATIDAMKQMGIEEWEKAQQSLDKALSLDPHNQELHQMQAIIKSKL